jgi:hypothetical protein
MEDTREDKGREIKGWRPKRTYKDVIHEFGNEISNVSCEADTITLTIVLKYDDIPDERCDEDLKILAEKLHEDGNGRQFSIIPRAKYTNQ